MGERIILRIDAEDASKETRPTPCADCGKETETANQERAAVLQTVGRLPTSGRGMGRGRHGGRMAKRLPLHPMSQSSAWARPDGRRLHAETPTGDEQLHRGQLAPEYLDRVLNGRGY